MEYKLAHSFEANAYKITYDWCFLILTIYSYFPNANKVHSISWIIIKLITILFYMLNQRSCKYQCRRKVHWHCAQSVCAITDLLSQFTSNRNRHRNGSTRNWLYRIQSNKSNVGGKVKSTCFCVCCNATINSVSVRQIGSDVETNEPILPKGKCVFLFPFPFLFFVTIESKMVNIVLFYTCPSISIGFVLTYSCDLCLSLLSWFFWTHDFL